MIENTVEVGSMRGENCLGGSWVLPKQKVPRVWLHGPSSSAQCLLRVSVKRNAVGFLSRHPDFPKQTGPQKHCLPNVVGGAYSD